MRLLEHLSLLAATASSFVDAFCKTDEDCSLLGVCLPTPVQTGTPHGCTPRKRCVCDSGWVGDDCSTLDLAPATRYTGYNQTTYTSPDYLRANGNSSWGGRILQDRTNSSVFHLFTSVFSKGCGLSGWRPHSYVMRAESHTGPRGPYQYAEAVTGGFRHNPDVMYSPGDDAYLMYTIGASYPTPQTKCESFTYVQWPNNISVQSSKSIRGPWTEPQIVVTSNISLPEVNIRATNPSPFPMWTPENPTREITLLFKDYHIYQAPQWDAKYTPIYEAEWNVTEGRDNPLWTEDPFVWRDRRGNWHSLNHWMIDLVENNGQQWPRVASHLFSRNLTGPWHWPKKVTFTSNVTFDDGSWELLKRRERPKLFFSDDGEMTPLYLISGVQAFNTGTSYTLIQPIGTRYKEYEKSLGF